MSEYATTFRTPSADDPVLGDVVCRLVEAYRVARDLAAADYESQANPPFVEDIVFHSQQAAEKSLKAFLSWHGLPFRKTHNLVGCPVIIQSAETSLGTAGKSARATLWRTLQRAASALMPTLGWSRVEPSAV